MSRPESPEARAERITAELREATREAAGVMKDLQAVIRSARAEVEEYLHTEVVRALEENTASMMRTVRQVTGDHETHVIERVTQFAALIENNFSRDALVREATGYIEKQVCSWLDAHEATAVPRGAGITIMACDRPHAD